MRSLMSKNNISTRLSVDSKGTQFFAIQDQFQSYSVSWSFVPLLNTYLSVIEIGLWSCETNVEFNLERLCTRRINIVFIVRL
jgi:hypothetical protein